METERHVSPSWKLDFGTAGLRGIASGDRSIAGLRGMASGDRTANYRSTGLRGIASGDRTANYENLSL